MVKEIISSAKKMLRGERKLRKVFWLIILLCGSTSNAYAEQSVNPEIIDSKNVKIEVLKTDNFVDDIKCNTIVYATNASGKFRFALWKDKLNQHTYINFQEINTSQSLGSYKIEGTPLSIKANVKERFKPLGNPVEWIEMDNYSTQHDFKYEYISQWKSYFTRAAFTERTEVLEKNIIIQEMPFTIVFGYSKIENPSIFRKLFNLIIGSEKKPKEYLKLTAFQINPKGLINKKDKETFLACEKETE